MNLKTGYENRTARVEMLPLIDVVFLLLVFFIYAMLSMVTYHGMKVELPRTGAEAPLDTPSAVVTIDAKNRLFLNQKPLSESALIEHLQAFQKKDPEAPILLEGDRKADLGVALELLNTLQQHHLKHLYFACKPTAAHP